MNEFSFTKFSVSVIAMCVAEVLRIPTPVWVLVSMMCGDLVLGAFAALYEENFSIRKLGWGIMRKMLCFVSLGGTHLMKDPMRLNFDPSLAFTDALIAYEFISICQSHIRLDLPGSPWLKGFQLKVEAAMGARRERKAAAIESRLSERG